MAPIRADAFNDSSSTDEVDRDGTRRRRRFAGLLLLIAAPLLYPLYTMNPSLGSAPETLSATLTAHSLAREGDFDLTEYLEAGPPLKEWARYSMLERSGATYSMEPLVSSLTFVPLLLPYRNVLPQRWQFREIGSRAAAQVAIAAAALLGLWLLSVTSVSRALAVAGIIALATNHRTTVAAGLWTHTSVAVWLVAGLFLWSASPRRNALYPWAAAALSAAVACRPILAPALLLVVADAWMQGAGRRTIGATVCAVGAVGGLVLIGNWSLYGSVLGGRAEIVDNITASHEVASYFRFSPLHWAGLLVSPSRGLFVYSPVLLFALGGMVYSLRSDRPRTLRLITLAGLLSFAAYGSIATWWGGWVFGPRYMTDMLPFLALWLALTPMPTHARPVWAALFTAALGWSIWVQQLGTSHYPCGWNRTPTDIDHDHARLWSLRDTQIARCVGAGDHAGAGSHRRSGRP